MNQIKKLNIGVIRTDGGTQIRASTNDAVIDEYSEAVKGGAEFPPVTVFYDGIDFWLADGFHRYWSYKRANKASIPAEIMQGEKRDAWLYSLGANDTNGLRRTNDDKRSAVKAALSDAELSKWSDNQIAKQCNVSHTFVSHIRASLTCNVASEKPTERTFKTKHGTTTTMQTENIGKVAAPETKPEKPSLTVVAAPVIPPEEQYTEMDAKNDQIADLQSMLALANLGEIAEEDKDQAKNLIEELRAEIKLLNAKLKAVTQSRDTFQNENAQLRKQITMQRREIDKVTGRKTA